MLVELPRAPRESGHPVVWSFLAVLSAPFAPNVEIGIRLDARATFLEPLVLVGSVIDEYLDQVAKDHKEERKKAIESGKGKGRAAITIDHPRDFSRIELSDDKIKFDGWALTDDENAKCSPHRLMK